MVESYDQELWPGVIAMSYGQELWLEIMPGAMVQLWSEVMVRSCGQKLWSKTMVRSYGRVISEWHRLMPKYIFIKLEIISIIKFHSTPFHFNCGQYEEKALKEM